MNNFPLSLNANPEALIAWFDDLGSGNEEYSYLSNFHKGDPITLPGVTWEQVFSDMHVMHQSRLINRYFQGVMPQGSVEFVTGEHAFAAMKCWGSWGSAQEFIEIVGTQDPNNAKALGRGCRLRPDWEIIKLDLMMAIQRAKYTLDREEGKRLITTGDALLIEGTLWGDDVWGVDLNDQNDASRSEGSNWLGTLIMARRAELKAQAYFGVGTRAGEKNAKTAVDGWQQPAWMKG